MVRAIFRGGFGDTLCTGDQPFFQTPARQLQQHRAVLLLCSLGLTRGKFLSDCGVAENFGSLLGVSR